MAGKVLATGKVFCFKKQVDDLGPQSVFIVKSRNVFEQGCDKIGSALYTFWPE